MDVRRTIRSPRPPKEVFAYLKDFTTTEEWDPGTVQTSRVAGDGGVGTRYHNVSRFLGRETSLTYVVEKVSEPHQLKLRGENETVIARDTLTLMPTAEGGTELSYYAQFQFKGLSRLLAPLLAPAFKRLGDEAEKGLREALR